MRRKHRRIDAFELLRTANPVQVSDVPSGDSPQAQELLARIKATPPSQPQSASRPRSRKPAAAYALVGLLAIGGVWWLTSTITQPGSITCYSEVSLQSEIRVGASGEELTAGACEVYWRDGPLVNPAIAEPGTVPPLTGCVDRSGALAVFPSGDPNVCATLGLTRPDPGTQDQAERIRQMEQELADFFLGSGCMALPDAEREARRILAAAGFGAWQVVAQPGNPDRPCASLHFDPPNRTVNLVPIPR